LIKKYKEELLKKKEEERKEKLRKELGQ